MKKRESEHEKKEFSNRTNPIQKSNTSKIVFDVFFRKKYRTQDIVKKNRNLEYEKKESE